MQEQSNSIKRLDNMDDNLSEKERDMKVNRIITEEHNAACWGATNYDHRSRIEKFWDRLRSWL